MRVDVQFNLSALHRQRKFLPGTVSCSLVIPLASFIQSFVAVFNARDVDSWFSILYDIRFCIYLELSALFEYSLVYRLFADRIPEAAGTGSFSRPSIICLAHKNDTPES